MQRPHFRDGVFMKRITLALAAGLVLAACAESPVQSPPDMDLVTTTALARGGPALSDLEQELVDQFTAGADMGAILDREIFCAFLTGFFDGPDFAGFGILFPQDIERDCNGSFARTNPDGTQDLHLNGSGNFFLVVAGENGGFFPSEGSDVRWTFRARDFFSPERGSGTFNVTGRLSDGSRVRAHFAYTADGSVTQGNSLWVEGIGYVVGGPQGR